MAMSFCFAAFTIKRSKCFLCRCLELLGLDQHYPITTNNGRGKCNAVQGVYVLCVNSTRVDGHEKG